jgi:hypothetical protein
MTNDAGCICIEVRLTQNPCVCTKVNRSLARPARPIRGQNPSKPAVCSRSQARGHLRRAKSALDAQSEEPRISLETFDRFAVEIPKTRKSQSSESKVLVDGVLNQFALFLKEKGLSMLELKNTSANLLGQWREVKNSKSRLRRSLNGSATKRRSSRSLDEDR